MSNVAVKTIIEENQEVYDRLLVSIEAGLNLLQLLVAVCDVDSQRERIINSYEQELAPTIQSYRAYLDPKEPSLRQAVAGCGVVSENMIMTVLGAEVLGLSVEDEALKKFFGYLQWTREALREIKSPIILWMPSRTFNLLIRQSPDFWSWRNGVFQFQNDMLYSIPLLELPVIQSIDLIEDDSPGSVVSIELIEHALKELISMKNPDSNLLETFYSLLGRSYVHRIRMGKSNDLEEEIQTAQNYLMNAIDIQKKYNKDESLAISFNSLALLYSSQLRYKEAEKYYLKSIELKEQKLGLGHPDLAASLDNIATLYQVKGQYEKAELFYLRSLDILQNQKEINRSSIATSLNNLATTYQLQGKYNDAEAFYRMSLESINHQSLEGDHNVAVTLNNLAAVYESQGRYSEAELIYLQSLENLKRNPNPDSYSSSLHNLAGLYKLQGKYSKAEPLYIESLKIQEKKFGLEHPDVACIINSLASLYESQGNFIKAEKFYLRSLDIRKKIFGEHHLAFANSLNCLAAFYQFRGRYVESKPLFIQSLTIRKQKLQADHPDIAVSLNNLASVYQLEGKYEEAEMLYLQSIKILEKALGQNHPDIAASMNNLATNYKKQKKYCEAESYYLRSIKIAEKQLGDNHPNTILYISNLAELKKILKNQSCL